MKDQSLLEGNEGEELFMKEIALMSSWIDQIGRDNTDATRGAAKIRIGSSLKRMFDYSPPPSSILPEGDWQASFWKAMNEEYPRAEHIPEIVCAFEYLRDNVINKTGVK